LAPDPRGAFDVTGRVAIVTGGGRSLGRAMSTGLAKAGARIVAVSRTQADLDETVAQIMADGGEAISVRADVSDYDALPLIVQTAVDSFGGVDILVNDAVDPYHELIIEMTPDLVERAYRANVHGPTFLAKAALPYLEASGHGSVINVASAAVFLGGSGCGPYRGSKAALMHMTRTMAKEWAPRVRANTLVPGPFETTIGGGYSEALRAEAIAHSPLERIAPYDEIVPHVLYLASDASAFITGTELMVDGGTLNGKGDNEGFKAVYGSMIKNIAAHQRSFQRS
jgi:NAD(P)-dependent dehydrogenase (short-subunit alcohol dehydrogenase family)